MGPLLRRMKKRKPHPTAGELIHAWRKDKGLTLRDLAERSGLHKSSIQRMEAGEQDPRASDIEAITAAMRLTPAEFYSKAAA